MSEIIKATWLVYKLHGEYDYIPVYTEDYELALEPGAELMEICGTKEAAIRSRDACYKLYGANNDERKSVE